MQSKAKARRAIRWLWTRALVLGLVSSALPLVSCLEPHIERYTFKVEVLNRTANTYLCVSSALQLDTDYLEWGVLRPTGYFEAGIRTGDPFVVGKFTQKGLYRTVGNLICRRFDVQGKIGYIE